jgi:hypothetical protein
MTKKKSFETLPPGPPVFHDDVFAGSVSDNVDASTRTTASTDSAVTIERYWNNDAAHLNVWYDEILTDLLLIL